MNTRLRCLIIFLFFLVWILLPAHVLAGPPDLPPLQEETSTPTAEESTPMPSMATPAEVIQAVNDLRILSGLQPLAVHPVLMEIAAEQASALAGTGGAIGHRRACGISLGEDYLSRGFALWGDLSQDGYRSENWGIASSAEEIVASWLGDDLHTNTMLSPNRSHIGAAVAVSDQIYIVLETAYQTPSGKMQYGADVYLTKIADKQAACAGSPIQDAENGDFSQYSIPVIRSTARPDGDVIHEVQYGQTLWSLAIDYGTTIEQIKRLNNLTSDTIVPGWTLLIQKGATQPAPLTVTPATFEPIRQDLYTASPSSTPALTEIPQSMDAGQFVKENSIVVVAFVISFSVLIAAIVGFGKKKE